VEENFGTDGSAAERGSAKFLRRGYGRFHRQRGRQTTGESTALVGNELEIALRPGVGKPVIAGVEIVAEDE